MEFRKFIVVELTLFRAVFLACSIFIPGSYAFDPYNPWKIIPSNILDQFDTNVAGEWMGVNVFEITRQTLIVSHSHIQYSASKCEQALDYFKFGVHFITSLHILDDRGFEKITSRLLDLFEWFNANVKRFRET